MTAAEGFIDPDALERSLARLRTAEPEDGFAEALQGVLAGTRALFEASGAGFMMIDDTSVVSAVAATDEPGRLLEGRQEERGHGPCVDSTLLSQITHTQDLAADDRWPELIPELPEAGVRAVLGVPISVGGVGVGALNVYRDHPHDWDDSEIAALMAFGRLIEGLLHTALEVRDRERLVSQLQHALNNRVVIERAVGVIMGRERTDAVTAFNQLRDRARSSERRVADVAAEVLAELVGNS